MSGVETICIKFYVLFNEQKHSGLKRAHINSYSSLGITKDLSKDEHCSEQDVGSIAAGSSTGMDDQADIEPTNLLEITILKSPAFAGLERLFIIVI